MTTSPSLPSSRPPPRSSLSTMKREQTAAVHPYGDKHTADDSVLQTEQGLRFSQGSVSSATRSATPSLPLSEERANGGGDNVGAGSRVRKDAALTSGTKFRDNSVRTTSDPMILEELHNLHKQVTRLEAERRRQLISTPMSSCILTNNKLCILCGQFRS
ncbi:hypothetical protein C8J57DRAFT_1236731 [Mycena rebaudengoi]|nr:hypothetical protein C8J57DRAFT_1236731 [Mycena rebaudengoi]